MRRLVAAEWRKLASLRVTWVLTIVGLVFVALTAFATLFAPFGQPFVGEAQQVADVVAAVGGNSAIVLVVALLSMTTEFRHGTVGRTLQITPSRTRVMVAKLVAGALYAVAFVALALGVVAVSLAIGAVVEGVGLEVGGPALETLWQALVGTVLTALLGVAFGALVRGQVVAIVVALVWIFFVENLVVVLWSDVARWLPFQALNGLFVPQEALSQVPAGTFVPLAGGPALVVFTAYVVVFTAAAAVLLRVRDI